MGKVKSDSVSNEERIRQEFPLETPQGVHALLTDIHHVRSSAYDKGDYDGINLLLDLEITSNKIEITNRQNEVVSLVFFENYTQQEAARELGIARQTVHQMIWNVVHKISNQYRLDLEATERGIEK